MKFYQREHMLLRFAETTQMFMQMKICSAKSYIACQ